jgi:glycosyltransferase involved in cell wall biosynthesis
VGTGNEAGRLVPPRDAGALAAAIAEVLAEPDGAARMGRAARARIERVFRWKDTAAHLVDVFEDTRRAAHCRSRAT